MPAFCASPSPTCLAGRSIGRAGVKAQRASLRNRIYGSVDVVDSLDSLTDVDGPTVLEADASLDHTAAGTSKTPQGGASGAGNAALKAMILLHLSAFFYGTTSVVIKVTEDGLSPLALDALRFGSAALCFSPWWLSAFRNKEILRPSLELGLWLAMGYTAQAYGLELTSAANGAFTCTFTVLAVPILVGLSGRKIAARTWLCAVAGLAGVGLLTTGSGNPNWGDFWCIFSAIMFGVHTWRSECITMRYPKATLQLVSGQLFCLGAVTTLMAVPEALQVCQDVGVWGLLRQAPSVPWPAILFLGVGTTAFSSWIELDALKKVASPVAALIYTMEPLWGASFSWVLLGERWGAQGWVGAAMILAASVYSQAGGGSVERLTSPQD